MQEMLTSAMAPFSGSALHGKIPGYSLHIAPLS